MIKWHDLTKHPDDLPEMFNPDGTGKAIAIIFVNANGEEIGHLASYRKIEDDWVYYRSSISINERVIRWAYLDGDGEGVADAPKPSPQRDMTELRDALIEGVENVDNQIHEFATDVKKNGDSFSEALTCALIGYMASEVKYGILKEFADYGKTD